MSWCRCFFDNDLEFSQHFILYNLSSEHLKHLYLVQLNQGLLDLDGRNSQKYLHQTWADF